MAYLLKIVADVLYLSCTMRQAERGHTGPARCRDNDWGI